MYKLKLKYSYIPMIISGTIILVTLWLIIIEPFYKEQIDESNGNFFKNSSNSKERSSFNLNEKKDNSSEISEITRRIFTIKGDLSEDELDFWWEKTIKWATTKLEKQFKLIPPQKKMSIWIFKNSKSYQLYSKKLFNIDPETPYGYFLPSKNSIIINVDTGGGTLVHELVHPYLEANFENIPTWINEGVASLYEQCSEKNGEMIGLTNWRLSELQKAINSGKLITFKELSQLSRDDFYNSSESSLYYAQSRYLFYYLQEKNLLKNYISELKSSQKSDLTGFETLQKTLNIKNWDNFEKTWKEFVLKLSFYNQ